MNNRIINLSIYKLLVFIGFCTVAHSQNYFQQEVNYTIHVKLNDVKHELNAFETIEYINNSPNDLAFIYMHIWPNAYKNNNTALAKDLLLNGETEFYFDGDEDKGYIDSLAFKVNDFAVRWEIDQDHIDICKLFLNEPLKSGGKIIITTPFHVKIPVGVYSRLGHLGQDYQITQWFPKPAVYDKNGWNKMPYLTQGEFYSEYGSFDVFVSLPQNYVVGATGDLVDGEEEIKFLERKVNETINRKSFDKKELSSFPTSDTVFKTLHYHQSNVHDFAWFASKRYNVLKGEVELPYSKNKVTTWAMFTNLEAPLWMRSIEYLNDAIYYYSLWNGDYSYKQVTAVDGSISAGAGMEYPNVTVIGESRNAMTLETTIMHEVGHNWFYGMLGSNERMHPWQDEGLNSFNENRYMETKYPKATLIDAVTEKPINVFGLNRYNRKYLYYLSYVIAAATNEDQPIETPAYEYSNLNYGGIVYAKTALVFDYLMAYLGEATMDNVMKKYFETWKFKHPQPADFRKIAEEVSGKKLGWLFDDIMPSTKRIDYQLSKLSKNKEDNFSIKVVNKGDVASPFSISAIKENKLIGTQWYEGFNRKQTISFPNWDFDKLKIDYNENIPEVNRNNNTLKRKGLFKKTEPLQLQFLGSLDNPDKTQLYFTPVIGWNQYNKTMLGLALYNNIIPQKKFEYVVVPFYAFGNATISGSASAFYNFIPRNIFLKQISIGATAARYAYTDYPRISNYNKIAPEIQLQFRNRNYRSKQSQSVRIRSIYLDQEMFARYDLDPANYKKRNQTKTINELSYLLVNKRKLNPYNLSLTLQQGDNMSKAFVEANYSITYKGKRKSFDIRFFAGTFLNSNNAGPYRYRTSGQRGYQDYTYDHVFLARSEYDALLSRQFVENDGGFKVYTPLGQSSKWITAINLKTSLPKIPMIRLFADIGVTANDGLLNNKLLYDGGVQLTIIPRIFEIYFPLFMSSDMKQFININNIKYQETIRFTLNINMLNPFQAIKSISF